MKNRVSMKLVWLGLAVAFTLASASVVNAQPGEFVKGVLQPLADGFPKRTINIIVVDDPGSRDDIYAKSLQAASKSISPVTITVSCEPSPSGGNWYTIQEAGKREGGKEGYYPIMIGGLFGVVTDLLTEPGTKEIGAKLDQLNMVITTEVMPYIMIQRKNAPWGPTWAGMVKYGKENPGKLRYISFGVGSAHDIVVEWLLKEFDLKVEKIPQGTFQECASTIGAGEGDFTLTLLDVALANWQANRVDVTAVLGGEAVPEMWSKDPNVVTKLGAIDTTFVGSTLGIGVPSQVPQAHVDWLNKLFKAAATSDLHKQRAKTYPGLVFRIVDGPAVNRDNEKLLKTFDPVVRALGMHVDSPK